MRCGEGEREKRCVNFWHSDRLLIESAEAVTICADAFNPN